MKRRYKVVFECILNDKPIYMRNALSAKEPWRKVSCIAALDAILKQEYGFERFEFSASKNNENRV